MLWTVAVVSSYTAGGLAHLLLAIAVIVVVFQSIGGRRPSDRAVVTHAMKTSRRLE